RNPLSCRIRDWRSCGPAFCAIDRRSERIAIPRPFGRSLSHLIPFRQPTGFARQNGRLMIKTGLAKTSRRKVRHLNWPDRLSGWTLPPVSARAVGEVEPVRVFESAEAAM